MTTAQPERPAESKTPAESPPRTFTIKAISFGVIALLIIILTDDYSNFYLRQQSLNTGFLPPGPLFLILAVALIWNPLWNRIAPFMVLSSRELIVSLTIVFTGCWTGGAGIAEFHAYTHTVPWMKYEVSAQKQQYESLEYVPEHLWPAGGLGKLNRENNVKERERVYDAFFIGYEKQKTDGVPWDAWTSTLTHWIPFFILLSACFIGMSLVVHQQWARHEQLPYPLANIAASIFDKQQGRALPNLFYMRSFWIAFALVGTFHGIRLLHGWWPHNFPNIEKGTSFGFIFSIFPTLAKSGSFYLNTFSFSFAAFGICYFLSREIGLTLGLSNILLAVVCAQLYIATGDKFDSTEIAHSTAGAYIAYACVILYTGRNYYRTVFTKAFTFSKAQDHEINSILGARILLLAFVGFVFVLWTSFELDFFIAFFFALLVLLGFLVFARVICETGIPFLQIVWKPNLVMANFFGLSTLGAAPLVILNFITTAAFMDAKNAMMPMLSNSLKIAEKYKMRIRRMCMMLLVLVSLAIVVAMTTRIHQHYTYGANLMSADGYGQNWTQKRFLNTSTDQLIVLEDIGQRHSPSEAQPLSLFDRAKLFKPDTKFISYAFLGAVCVFAFFFLRFRYTGFPLHPVLFLIWGSYHIGIAMYSFLIGWCVRELIIRFGGDKIYQGAKPFFIGLVLGELFLILLSAVSGMGYNIFTGEMPPKI